jgi:cyanate permease
MLSTLQTSPKLAWRMVAVGFVAQNLAIGLSIASFGVVVLAIEQEFHTSRALASLGVALALGVGGAISPLAAGLIERWSIKRTMMLGVVVGSLGYVALALAPTIGFFLAAYALLVGVGALLAGGFSASILVSNWFPGANGRALGVVMIPLGAMLVPLAGAPILEAVGLRRLYLLMAAANLLLLPLLLLVRDRPAEFGDPERQPVELSPPPVIATPMRVAEILRRPQFWLLILGMGLLDGSGMVKISQLVALTAERGFTLHQATLLLSVSGGAGAVGTLLFGWLADRIGGAAALTVNALVQAAGWSIFLLNPGMNLLLVDAALMGLAGAGVYAVVIVALTQQFGAHNLPRALGLAGAFGIIPTFLCPPLAGLLRDISGSYALVLYAVIGACLTAASATAVVMMRPTPLRQTAPAI